MSVPLLLLPQLLLLLLFGMAPVTSVAGSVQIASFNKWRKTARGPLICPLDLANETVSSSSLQDCSRSCARVITCSSFSIKNSLICDLYHYKARLAAPVSGCVNYQVLSRSRSLSFLVLLSSQCCYVIFEYAFQEPNHYAKIFQHCSECENHTLYQQKWQSFLLVCC